MMSSRTNESCEQAAVPQAATLGLCLDSDQLQAAYWKGPPGSGNVESVTPQLPPIPPAALVPRFVGEPARAAISWPTHTRGSGETWPPEAIVGPETGAGRLPLAHAWAQLMGTMPGEERWRWTGAGRDLTPAEAIVSVASAVVLTPASGADDSIPVLVIPNCSTGAQQQELIDAARRQGLRLRLLWRPVAAAIEWCKYFEKELASSAVSEGVPLGQLLCLHMGLDNMEAAVLKIVPIRRPDGQLCFVPARPRPRGSQFAGFGLALAEKLAELSVSTGMSDAGPGVSWRLLWSTPWLPTCLSILRGRTPPAAWAKSIAEAGFPSRLSDQSETWPGVYASMASSWQGPEHGIGFRQPWTARGLREWTNESLQVTATQGEPMLGAVVTGAFAGVAYGRDTVGCQWLRKCNADLPMVLCEGRDQPTGLLARAAALHSIRLAAGLPTYLDTLPRLEVVVTRLGEPVWESLLQEDESFVDGGRQFRKEGVGEGEMRVEAGSATLDISLHHGEHPTVRMHTIHLPRVSGKPMPISLDVSMTPAQGNARVEVQPGVAGFFGHHCVVVDWRGNMQESGKGPDEYLASIPRILPPASPREGSELMWGGGWYVGGHSLRGAAAKIDDYLDDFLRTPGLQHLEAAIKSLQYKDRSVEPGEYTAVSSEGRPGRDLPKDRKLLDRFVAALMRHLRREEEPDRDKVVRALTYTSTDHRGFARYLSGRIKEDGANMTSHDRAACGWCLRNPNAIAKFAAAALAALGQGASSRDWIKPLWEILRYREDATLKMSSSFCLRMTRQLLGIFKSEVRNLRFKLIFRYASGSIAYLLRRRRYDTVYLDPASRAAHTVKSAFENAIKLVKDHPENVIGGFIKIPDQLRLIVDYIDLRGHGPVMM